MAIKEIKREWQPCQLAYVKHFLLHTEDDLKNMPRCSVGSRATVSETDNEYVKTADGWKLLCDCDEDGGQGAGGGGASSWNDLTDKPFGTEIVYKTLFDGTVTTADGWNATRYDPIDFSVYDYDEYKVIFDGTEYALKLQYDDYESGFIGSASLWNNVEYVSSEPPFCYSNGWFGAAVDGEHTVIISTPVEKPIPIDPKYVEYELNLEAGVTTKADLEAIDGKYSILKVGAYRALSNFVSWTGTRCEFDCISRLGQVVVSATFDDNGVVSEVVEDWSDRGINVKGKNGLYYTIYVDENGALGVKQYHFKP